MFWLISKGPMVFVMPFLLFIPLVSLPNLCLEDVEIPYLEIILVIYYLFSLFYFLLFLFQFENVIDMHRFKAFSQGVAVSYHLVVPPIHD